MKLKKEQIKIVIEDTNFQLIHKTMKSLNWTWIDSKTKERRVPSILELKITAINCIKKAINSNSGYAQIGGFECDITQGVIELRFVLTRVNPLSKLLN